MDLKNGSSAIGGAAMTAMLIASAQAPLGSTLIAVALPSVGAGLQIDVMLATSLLVSSYLIVNILLQAPGGKLSDVVGHSKILWIGMTLFGLGAFTGLVAPGLGLLTAARCIMAVGGALVVPATLALLRIHVPVERRGRIFGLFGSVMALSAALGPALGGEIVSRFGWRAVFLANLPFLAVAMPLLYLRPLRDRPLAARPTLASLAASFDFVGLGLLALSLVLLIGSPRGEPSQRPVMLLAAVLIGAVFVFWEMRATEPIVAPMLFRSKAFAASTSIMALQNFAMYGLLFELPEFFVRFRGSSAREVGYMLFAMMIGMVVSAPAGGRLTDRFGARAAALMGASLLIAGSLLLCRLTSFAFPLDAAVPLLLFGLGLGLCSAPAQSTSISAADPTQAGLAAGVSSTMRYLGGISSIAMLGAILGKDADMTEGRHQLMVVIFTVATVLSALASWFIPGRRAE